jgi:uncharacterized metal-binding protein
MIPMQTGCSCGGSTGPQLIYSCSGAADVGELADLVARKLNRERAGSMFCLAAISGRVSGIMKSTEAASSILAIDGCALDCTKKTLEAGGFKRFNHLRITDLGFEKGKTEVDAKSIAKVTEKAKSYL